jgi:hypothetical protein
MTYIFGCLRGLAVACMAFAIIGSQAQAEEKTFSENVVIEKSNQFFGATTEGLATAVRKVFSELGEPNGVILGEEVSGAFVVGLRYGKGDLETAAGEKRKVYWQGPSIGFDWGGNASKVFTLVYNIKNTDQIYQRFPGVDGSFYFVAGVGVNYQRTDGVTLAPIRTGGGLRMGASIGYLHYNQEHSWIPF